MKWTPGGESSDIEDRRGGDDDDGGGYRGGGGGGGGFGFGGVHLGLGGTVVVVLLSLAFKRNFFSVLQGAPGPIPAPTHHSPTPGPPGSGSTGSHRASKGPDEEREVKLVSFVLDDVQRFWEKDLPAETQHAYPHAKLVLFDRHIESACGYAQSAMGPFYCAGDRKVYIDLSFYDELKRRFGAPGEFAQAYVIAHEVGHHVQNLLGLSGHVESQSRAHPAQANALSVRLELQADCFAGVWAHSTEQRQILESGDVDSALGAAAAVGDDRLQKQATGRISPETFTHGTSAQRTRWFKRGFESGRVDSCDTFAAAAP